MTNVNGIWNARLATNSPVSAADFAASRGRGRRQLRLVTAIGAMEAHLDRCDSCLASGHQLCYEGTYALDEVDIARTSVLRHDLRRRPARLADHQSKREFARSETAATRLGAVRRIGRPIHSQYSGGNRSTGHRWWHSTAVAILRSIQKARGL
ncbi:MAG: hypothetical protein L3K15_08695 [Thermoplasmata archaeon]|nr:hypothetical protein [Thermoplasmata archaeon]